MRLHYVNYERRQCERDGLNGPDGLGGSKTLRGEEQEKRQNDNVQQQ